MQFECYGDTKAPGTDTSLTELQKHFKYRSYSLSRRDHYNQAIRWSLHDTTRLSYGREDGFRSFLHLSFTSSSSHARFRFPALMTRVVEQVTKRGVITCEVYIFLYLKTSMRSQWPVLRFSVSIDLLNLLAVHPSFVINTNLI